MLLLLAGLGGGFLVGFFRWLPEYAQTGARRLVNGTLLLLLFCVGAKIGTHEQVLRHLGGCGLKAGLLGFTATAASATAAWLWSRCVEREGKKEPEEWECTA